MPRRSATVSLAVPMSIPAYSCIESALMISPPTSSASRSASSDLPAAVGPSTAITRSATPHSLPVPPVDPCILFNASTGYWR